MARATAQNQKKSSSQDAISTRLRMSVALTDAANTAIAQEPEPAPDMDGARATVDANPSSWSKSSTKSKKKPSSLSLRSSLRNCHSIHASTVDAKVLMQATR